MGWDIHLYAEFRKEEGWGWLAAGELEEDEDGGPLEIPYKERLYTGRNYELFSILAGVRNGSNLKSISDPVARGLPPDVSLAVLAQSNDWGADGHAHSFLSLKEILDFDWIQKGSLSGVVKGPTYKDWFLHSDRKSGPTTYCSAVSGLLINVIREPNHSPEGYSPEELERTYFFAEWAESYHLLCPHFWSECIPRLLPLGPPNDVRIVFWFDN